MIVNLIYVFVFLVWNLITGKYWNGTYKLERNLTKYYNTDDIVKEICNGRLKFHREFINTYAGIGYVSQHRRFKLYTEGSGGACGSFPYWRVKGTDIEVDHNRIEYAIQNKVDKGDKNQYSWL